MHMVCITSVRNNYHFDANMVNSKLSKGAKIRNRYNQVPHLTQDTNGEVTNSQLDITNESQEVSPFPPQSTYKQTRPEARQKAKASGPHHLFNR